MNKVASTLARIGFTGLLLLAPLGCDDDDEPALAAAAVDAARPDAPIGGPTDVGGIDTAPGPDGGVDAVVDIAVDAPMGGPDAAVDAPDGDAEPEEDADPEEGDAEPEGDADPEEGDMIVETLCADFCEERLAVTCAIKETSQQCVAACEAIHAGDCGEERNAFEECVLDTVDPFVCNATGIELKPGVCTAEQTALAACLQ